MKLRPVLIVGGVLAVGTLFWMRRANAATVASGVGAAPAAGFVASGAPATSTAEPGLSGLVQALFASSPPPAPAPAYTNVPAPVQAPAPSVQQAVQTSVPAPPAPVYYDIRTQSGMLGWLSGGGAEPTGM